MSFDYSVVIGVFRIFNYCVMKKSSYQKLKEEIELLKSQKNELISNDIYNLVTKQNESEGVLIKIKWLTVFAMENCIMRGDITETKLTGLL